MNRLQEKIVISEVEVTAKGVDMESARKRKQG